MPVLDMLSTRARQRFTAQQDGSVTQDKDTTRAVEALRTCVGGSDSDR